MSGKFIRLFGLVLSLAVVGFVLFYFVGRSSAKWSFGEAFTQLSNPSTNDQKTVSIYHWLAVVAMNLFGLFIINGVVLTLWVNWVSNRKERHKKGQARYEGIFDGRFSVIIGGHKIVAALARELFYTQDLQYIVIQTQRDPEILRWELASEITNKDILKNIIIYSGDRVSRHEVAELHLDLAQEVYIIGESRSIDVTSHDAINMQTWKIINEIYKESERYGIPCHIMFEYQSTFNAFQFTDVSVDNIQTFKFIPFSLYENWAQQVLVPSNLNGNSYYMPLDGETGLPFASDERVHLIIVGMSKMGMALATEAAHVAHYPNFNNHNAAHPRTLITFIDRNAHREMTFFMGRYRELFQLARWRYIKAPGEIIQPKDNSWDIYDLRDKMFDRANDDKYRWHDPMNDPDLGSPYYGGYLGEDLIDIDFEFIEGDVALPSIQKYISDAGKDKKSKTTIAVCLPVASEAMSAALYFESAVYENVQQIWIQQSESDALVDAISFGLTGKDSAKFRKLRPFGMLEKCDYLTRIHSLLPKLVSFAYNCIGRETTLANEYHKLSFREFMDSVESNWLSISNDKGKSVIAQKWSNIYCANSFDSKVRSMNIDLTAQDVITDMGVISELAKTEHNRWVMEQILLGCRPVPNDYKDAFPFEDDGERERLKALNFSPDLISNEILGTTRKYDEGIVAIIPLAIAIANEYDKTSTRR